MHQNITLPKIRLKKLNILIATLLLTFISCQKESDQLKPDSVLAKKIEAAFKSKSETVDLQKHTDFEWDSIVIFGPYSGMDNAELNLSNIQENLNLSNDGIHTIVFLKDNTSVKFVELSRLIGDFKDIKTQIPKEKATFLKTTPQIKLVSEE
ncbi:hypothetical protein [Aquimarina sediminis]|uniref:hypothetical protein n=1 Tax=Aquimarina sediminis TaxID=2070536 RepID=UPI000CA077EA|nr:hypothetical protein [Aquimarina sediminis]